MQPLYGVAHHHSSSLIDQHSALLVTFLLPLQEQRFSYQTRPSCRQTPRLRKRADYRVDSLRSLHGRLARHPTGSSVPGRPSFSSSHHASHGKITACFRVSVPDIQAESDLIVPLFGLSVNGFFYNPQPTGSPFFTTSLPCQNWPSPWAVGIMAGLSAGHPVA